MVRDPWFGKFLISLPQISRDDQSANNMAFKRPEAGYNNKS